MVLVQAVPHCVCPELQLELHWLLLQTGADDGQTFPQLPQLLASDVTHDEPHSIPDEQAHFPAWQLCPDWQTVPQAPQLWLSVCTLAQVPLHSSWPEEQVVPAAGLAQPAKNGPEPRATTRAKREAVRASIFQTPYGGFGATTKRWRATRDGHPRYVPVTAETRSVAGAEMRWLSYTGAIKTPTSFPPAESAVLGEILGRDSGAQTPRSVAAHTTRLTFRRQQPTPAPFLAFHPTERNY